MPSPVWPGSARTAAGLRICCSKERMLPPFPAWCLARRARVAVALAMPCPRMPFMRASTRCAHSSSNACRLTRLEGCNAQNGGPGLMLRVGVPEMIDRALHAHLPQDVHIEVLPAELRQPVEVDFWIVPPYPKPAEAMWQQLRGVRVAQSVLAGVDWLLRLVPREVTVCDARGVHDISTAEWAVAATLASLKYFPLYGQVQRAAEWKRRSEATTHFARVHEDERSYYPPVMLEDLHGKRVLIVGYGSIGSRIEQLLQPFAVEVDRIARTARAGVASIGQLPALLPLADVIILIVPLTEETRGLIGAGQLAAMKQGALLVNAARGPVVDTDALI